MKMRPLLFSSYICRSCRQSQSLLPQYRQINSVQHVSRRSSSSSVQQPRPRIAIVGSGPAGFYTAATVMKHLNNNVAIDMFDKLPVPYGLTRYGVAPDHPEVRNCQEKFAEVASHEHFTFTGNVNVGYDISLDELRNSYDALVFSYGSSNDKLLPFPLVSNNVFPASRLVEWYTGHPDLSPALRETFGDWSKVKNVVIIGNGNVALDVARMLLLAPTRLNKGGDMARNSDMPTSVMEALSRSAIKNVHVVGRRGAPQAKFTTKELRELLTLDNVQWNTESSYGSYRPYGKESVKKIERARRRVLELLDKHYSSSSSSSSPSPQGSKNLHLHFLSSPSSISDDHATFAAMEYASGADTLSASANVIESKTESPLQIPADRVFLAIGYTAVPLPGFEDWNVAFSRQRGLIRNFEGRVVDGNGIVMEGLYVSGWLKRGAEGVIAATWADAVETGEIIASDLSLGLRNPKRMESRPVRDTLMARGFKTVRWSDWKAIDAEELRRGKDAERGGEREKILERGEFWKALDSS